MKFKLLVAVLLLSFLFNAAGVVFLVLFIDARSDIRKMRKERHRIEQKLALAAQAVSSPQDMAAANAQEAAQAKQAVTTAINPAMAQMITERVEKRKFFSVRDGVEDEFALQMPRIVNPAGCTLVVWLHGLGSNMMQPWAYPADVCVASSFENVDADTCVLSCNYRKESSWGNDAAVADISQNIRHVMQELPCKRIVIAGGSMGACSALGYAIQAPPDIKAKLSGVMSFQGAGDLAELYRQTAFEPIRATMVTAFGGNPEQVPEVYRSKSFTKNIASLPKYVRVAIVSTDQDNIIPSKLQFDVADQLQSRQYSVTHLRLHGDHSPPASTAYGDAYKFVLGR